MARKKRPEEPEKPENAERYMLTYSDMITLLMTFFIVLYAMSSVSAAKYQQVAESLSAAFSGMPGIQAEGAGGHSLSRTNAPLRAAPGTGLSPKHSKKSTPFMERATSTLQTQINTGTIRLNTEARGVVLGLSGDIFFREGGAALSQDALASLEPVAELLSGLSEPIVVEGFTDATPVDKGSQFGSNLGLSSARAVAVAEALELLGVSKDRVSATGFGDAKPLRSNDSPEGRAYNRRVDILIVFDEE
jgi:chemotaxis protein MotB